MPRLSSTGPIEPPTPDLTRRQAFYGLLTAVGGVGFGADASALHTETVPHAPHSLTSQWNVLDFGAKGDGRTDNTVAFQAALDEAGKSRGGTVFAPAGRYRFTGTLRVPSAVTLAGVASAMPAYEVPDPDPHYTFPQPGDNGTTLLATAGRGQEQGTPFIALDTNSTLRGVVIWYPEQDAQTIPVPYPWAVAMRGQNSAILDIALINPYQGIDATGAKRRPYIRGVYGQPLRRGILTGNVRDIGRIADVQFVPGWSWSNPVRQFLREHGEAFIFADADWLYVFNCFSFDYGVGFSFPENSNILLTQCGADRAEAPGVCVKVSAAQNWCGIAFMNGQFVGDIVVEQSNDGPVKFTSCAFTNGRMRLAGSGSVSFASCTISGNTIDAQSPLLITGCDLGGASVHIGVSDGSAVVVGNRGVGTVTDESKKAQVIGNL